MLFWKNPDPENPASSTYFICRSAVAIGTTVCGLKITDTALYNWINDAQLGQSSSSFFSPIPPE